MLRGPGLGPIFRPQAEIGQGVRCNWDAGSLLQMLPPYDAALASGSIDWSVIPHTISLQD